MIVITAPTGTIGHQVLQKVLKSDVPIRVIVRDPSRLSAQTRERVEVVQGSHGDIDVVNQAFKGADTVFWLVPPDPQAKSVDAAYVDFTRPACEAIKKQGVKRVVDITPLGRGLPVAARAGFVTASLAMDDLIASTGVGFRPLTMPSFMDNILMQLAPIKTKGVFFSPIDGDRKLPACATRDIAAVAAQWLRIASSKVVGVGSRQNTYSIIVQSSSTIPEELSTHTVWRALQTSVRQSSRSLSLKNHHPGRGECLSGRALSSLTELDGAGVPKTHLFRQGHPLCGVGTAAIVH